MRPVTITITFETDALPEEVAGLAEAALVQIVEPVDADGNDAAYEVRNAEVVIADPDDES